MMPFSYELLTLEGLILVRPKVYADERGYFMELFKSSDMQLGGITGEFVQDNLSYSRKGTVRGLHYQMKPKMQGKLVTCLRGTIYDVAVDIRVGSPTFGKWVAVELSEENHHLLWIPEGFAHGFMVLSEEAMVLYKVSGSEYSPEHDAGIRWDDPELNVDWPIKDVAKLIISEKDKHLPTLRERLDRGNCCEDAHNRRSRIYRFRVCKAGSKKRTPGCRSG